MTLVKQAEYAAFHNVSRKTVTKWKQAGYLVFEGDLVDVEASDERLRGAALGRFKDDGVAATPVTVTHRALPQGNGGGNAGNKGSAPRHDPSDDDGVTAEGPNGQPLEEFFRAILEGRFAVKADAEAAKENALAAIRLLELMEKDGSLIRLELAEAVFFEQARGDRDAWMNWPSRVGPVMAAEFGLPADKVTEVLTRHVHEELAGRGEPQPDFSRDEG